MVYDTVSYGKSTSSGLFLKNVCFLSVLSTINWMIVATCLFYEVSTAQYSTRFIYIIMNSIPLLFCWKTLYNKPRFRHMPFMIIFTVVNTPYLLIDGLSWKGLFTHHFFVILARLLQWMHFPGWQYSDGLSSSCPHTVRFHGMTSCDPQGTPKSPKQNKWAYSSVLKKRTVEYAQR